MNRRHTFTRLFIALLALVVAIPFAFAQDSDSYNLPTTLNDAASIEAQFEDEITTLLYGFTATAGDVLTITMTQDDGSDLDPYLLLFDAEGAVIAADDDGGEMIPFSAQLSDVTIPDDGNYYLLATSFFFIDGSSLTADEPLPFTITINGLSAQDAPLDVIELDATSISYGDGVAGVVSADAPVALFAFIGQTGDVVQAEIETDGFLSALHLFAPDGERLAIDPFMVEAELPDDGVYLIIATDLFFYEVLTDEGFFDGGEFVLTLSN